MTKSWKHYKKIAKLQLERSNERKETEKKTFKSLQQLNSGEKKTALKLFEFVQ